jgi:hypothetical protein
MHDTVQDPIHDQKVHERRWWTLGVLCLSLLIVMVANTSRSSSGDLAGASSRATPQRAR